MSKIIFLDVDGTLIDYEAKLPASAAKAAHRPTQAVMYGIPAWNFAAVFSLCASWIRWS